jgi:hypothetical protein
MFSGRSYDPPASGLRINLYQMAGNHCGHVSFLGYHVEVNAGAVPFCSPIARTMVGSLLVRGGHVYLHSRHAQVLLGVGGAIITARQ